MPRDAVCVLVARAVCVPVVGWIVLPEEEMEIDLDRNVSTTAHIAHSVVATAMTIGYNRLYFAKSSTR